MGRKSNKLNKALANAAVVAADQMPATTGSEPKAIANAFMNSFAETIGLGGGVSPMGYPFNQYAPGSATVENVGTIFKNLRWYMISNMRQVLNQAYVEFGLVQTIVDVPVDDALRGGVQIKSKQLEESQIEEIKASLDRDDDLNTAGQAAKWNRLFGGAGVLILTDQDPEEPLDLDQITEDTPLEFRAVDMWELFWDKQNTEGYDPTIQEENFEYYNYYGEQVHKSRVMRLKGLTAPSFIRPRLRGWGFSVVEILVRSINQYLKGTDLAFEVLDEFKVDVFKISGLTQALASPVGVEAIKKRVQLANWEKNYNNALTMDKEDDWDHKQLSFAGLGDAMMQIRMQVAADMRMPLTKLFGISAAGFNSGEDDIEVYNAMVESQVRNKIKYTILRMIEIKCQQKFGFIPDDLQISFEPLRYMSSEQEETVKTQKFQRLLQALQAGAIPLKIFLEACNKSELFDVTVDTNDQELLDGYMADQVNADGNEESVEGDDDPGASRVDTARPTAGSKGGAPSQEPKKQKDAKDGKPKGDKEPPKAEPSKTKNSRLLIMPKPYSTAQRATRAVTNSATFDRKSYEADGGDGWIDSRRKLLFDRDKAADKGLWDRATAASRDALGDVRWQFVVWFYKKYGGRFGQLQNSDKWDESKHPRADDGKFGKGGGGDGGDKGKPADIAQAAFKKKYPAHSGSEVHETGLDKDGATTKARELRAKGVHATIAHMDGPKTGPKSKYFVMVPEGAKADDVEMIEVGADGEFSTDLTEEQEATARARFAEAARGPEGKNPATETPEETSERQHKLEKATRERAGKEQTGKYSEESGVPEILGKTSTGKTIYSHFEHPEHEGFTEKEHAEAAAAHEQAYAELAVKWLDQDTKFKRASKDKRDKLTTVDKAIRKDVFITMQEIATKHSDAASAVTKQAVIAELVQKTLDASEKGDRQMALLHVKALKELGVGQAEFDELRKGKT